MTPDDATAILLALYRQDRDATLAAMERVRELDALESAVTTAPPALDATAPPAPDTTAPPALDTLRLPVVGRCDALKYTLVGNEVCTRSFEHKGDHRYVDHDCPDCGRHHGTCRQCGTTHGDSHENNCPHAKTR